MAASARRTQKLRESGQGQKAASAERKQEESWEVRYKRQREEEERKGRAWDAVRVRALERMAVALKKAGPTPRVVAAVMELVNLHGDDQKVFDRLIGKVTAANVAIAVLLARIVDDLSRDHDEFVRVAKVYGVDIADLTAERKQLLEPKASAPPKSVQTSAPKKKAAKKTGKKKR
jgi:hypothetical protein